MAQSFKSILDDIGRGLKTFFTTDLPKVVGIAQEAEPVVDLATAALPGIPALYNATVNEVVAAEAAAASAGAQSGTGSQKLAAVVTAITPTFNAYAAANGLATPTTATIQAYVSAVVDGLNAIPAA